MNPEDLRRFLALLLSLNQISIFEILVQTAPAPAPAVATVVEPVFDAQAIQNETELQAALADPETNSITLANDIITLEDLVVNRAGNLELNLGGYKIASLRDHASVIDVQSGNLAILGHGGIVATGAKSSAVRIKGAMTPDNSNYSRVMIGAEVTLYAPTYFGIYLAPNFNAAYGAAVDLYGTIIAANGIGVNGNIVGEGKNAPRINLADQAKIIADEHTGTALQANGYALWEIGASDLTGATGISLKSGRLHLAETRIISTGEHAERSGAVFQLEPVSHREAELQIDGGEYLSVQSYVFNEFRETDQPAGLRSYDLHAGSFSGQLGVFHATAPEQTELSVATIYGGSFNADIDEYLAAGRHLERQKAQGIYLVIDESEPEIVLDKAAELALAKTKLEQLIELSARYTAPEYTGNELGELQSTVNKSVNGIRRAVKAAEKLLGSDDYTTLKLRNATRKLDDAIGEVRSIEDAMRTEVSEEIRLATNDKSHYTPDSYLDLAMATADAEQLLSRDNLTLVELQDALGVIDAAKVMLEEFDPDDIESLAEAVDWEDLLKDQAANPDAAPPKMPETKPILLRQAKTSPVVAKLASTVKSLATQPTPAALPEPVPAPKLSLLTAEPTALPAASPAETPVDQAALEQAQAELQALLTALNMLSPANYTLESYAVLERTMHLADGLLHERAATATIPVLQSALYSVNIAYNNLVKEAQDPVDTALADACANLQVMLTAVQDLAVSDYRLDAAEQFGELQVAIVKSKAVLGKTNVSLTEVVSVMDEIAQATSGLKANEQLEKAASAAETATVAESLAQPEVTTNSVVAETTETAEVSQPTAINWDALREVIADISALNSVEYTAASYQQLITQLNAIKPLLGRGDTTQHEVDEAVFELNLALLALERVTAPRLSALDSGLDDNITPSWLMSMMAGAYAGLATYRRSRLEAKNAKH